MLQWPVADCFRIRLELKDCMFQDLPEECKEYFQSNIFGDPIKPSEYERYAEENVYVVYYDMDGDGIDELFMLRGIGHYGSGGIIYLVFHKKDKNSKYELAGEIFGHIIGLKFDGILVATRCGWEHTYFSYCRLVDGKIQGEYGFEVQYTDSDESRKVKKITLLPKNLGSSDESK